jgi:hypothetical protein
MSFQLISFWLLAVSDWLLGDAAFLRNEMAGAQEGMASAEFLFRGSDGNPGRDGAGLLDRVALFVAIVFAIGEGVILGRDAVGEFEVAVCLLGRVDGTLELTD